MLKSGFARADVTPPLGAPLAGYYSYRPADGVLDPIELVALAVSDGENTVLVITGDFMGMFGKWATEIRTLISEETGVDEGCIYLQALHQHTSIKIGRNPHLYDVKDVTYYEDETYYKILYRKYVDVAKEAIADMMESKVSVGEQKTAVDLSFVRRFLMQDGSIQTNPSIRKTDQIVKPVGEADNVVRLVRFERETGDIALVNFSTHPDVIGGKKFSADWPGFVRRMTEKDLPGVSCICMVGAQGDVNHVNRLAPPTTLAPYEFSAYMGRTITDTVLSMWNHTKPAKEGKVYGQVRVVRTPTNTLGMEEIEECQELKKQIESGIKIHGGMERRADIYRIAALHRQPILQEVTVSVIGFGNIKMLGYGGEPFTEYATDARNLAADAFVLTTCNTNGYNGYLPGKEAFAEGGYEAVSSNYTDHLVTVLKNTTKEMLGGNEHEESN